MGKIKSLAAAGAGAAVLAVGWHYVYGAGSGKPSNGFGIGDDPNRVTVELAVDSYNSKQMRVDGFVTYHPGSDNKAVPFSVLPWTRTIKVPVGTTVVLVGSADDYDHVLFCRITPGPGATPAHPVIRSGMGRCDATVTVGKAGK